MGTDAEGRGDTTAAVLFTAGFAILLLIGTTVGVVNAVNSSSADRVVPTSTAPIYGSR